MSKEMGDLIEIIQYLVKQQQILTKMLIHIGCRADLYDNFIGESFNELQNLKIPNFKEADK